MSCGALALEPWLDQEGLTWDDIEYHAFEIDKYADAVSRYNYPLMYRHGDARNYKNLLGEDIFLLMGGFPCQPYSFSGKGKADADDRDLPRAFYKRGLARFFSEDTDGACIDWNHSASQGYMDSFKLIKKNCEIISSNNINIERN